MRRGRRYTRRSLAIIEIMDLPHIAQRVPTGIDRVRPGVAGAMSVGLPGAPVRGFRGAYG